MYAVDNIVHIETLADLVLIHIVITYTPGKESFRLLSVL